MIACGIILCLLLVVGVDITQHTVGVRRARIAARARDERLAAFWRLQDDAEGILALREVDALLPDSEPMAPQDGPDLPPDFTGWRAQANAAAQFNAAQNGYAGNLLCVEPGRNAVTHDQAAEDRREDKMETLQILWKRAMERNQSGLQPDPELDFELAQVLALIESAPPARACASWCGLPLGDHRVPYATKERRVYFAGQPVMTGSAAYCCPQRPEDRE